MTSLSSSETELIEHTRMASGTTYLFDPASQAVVNSFPAVHKSHNQLLQVINETSSGVASSTEHGRTAIRNGLTYDQFMAGLLYNEETMLVNSYLYFDYVVFAPEAGSPPRANITQGRAFLTNHRLLLLSAELYQGLSLTSLAHGVDKRPSGYMVTGKATDIVHYLSIPLDCIKSVELDVSVGVEAQAAVRGERPCCLLAALSCCGMEACLKHWTGVPSGVASATNLRTLNLGVTLPPWGHRYMVQLHLNAGAPLALVKDYIVAFNRFSPTMATKPQNPVF
ncbi:uncharacterized protein [Diadema setosum]|uniref:uncharacterized protein n=1 Tax=Diadema setosum TaxID=31175 RepID=UPI003B3B3B02